MGVVMLDEGINLLHELLDVGERAAADGFLGNDSKPTLDLIEPRGIGRGVVDMEPGPPGQPGLDLGVFMGGVVVDDQVDVQIVGHIGIDMTQEGEELLVAMTPFALGQDLASSDIECGEQGRGAMADIVVRDPFDVTEPHGQYGLGSVEGLDLGFLVDAQDHGMVGRIEVQPDDVTDFLDEKRIIGDFEMPLAMGLNPEQVEPTLDGALGDAGLLSHGAHAPMGAVGRIGLQRRVDDLGNPFIVMGSGTPWAQFVMQAFEALFQVTFAPFTDSGVGHTQAFGDRAVGFAFGAGEDDLSALDDAVWQGSGMSERGQVVLFFIIKDDGCGGSTTRHGVFSARTEAIIISLIYGTLH